MRDALKFRTLKLLMRQFLLETKLDNCQNLRAKNNLRLLHNQVKNEERPTSLQGMSKLEFVAFLILWSALVPMPFCTRFYAGHLQEKDIAVV